MKPVISALYFCAISCLFAACFKTSIPIPPPPGGSNPSNPGSPSNQAISFFASSDSAYVAAISVDTTRDVGFEYPQIIINGTAIIPNRKDTLTFELQIYNSTNTYTSATQFMGNFNDTSRSYHTTNLTLNSQVNYNAYQNAFNGANDFYVNISANDGKTLTATFYGSLVCFANNTGAPPTLPITKGTMKINLP